MTAQLTVGSLFAGVGGFDLAAERAGMRVVWQSEYDRHASEVLADHWPEVPNYGDIHDIRFRRDEPDGVGRDRSDRQDRAGLGRSHREDRDGGGGAVADAVDVLVGGFPCQDYSLAGQRGGLDGDRGALWWEFHRLIAEGRPRWIVGENVPGLLSSRAGRDFGTIVDSIVELGYRVAWRVLDAQHFGVAQRRRRVFIVGHSGDRSASSVLALADGLSGYPRPVRRPGPSTTDRDRGATPRGSGSPVVGDAVTSSVTSSWAKGPTGGGDGRPIIIHATQNPGVAYDRAHALGVSSTQAVAFTENQRSEVRDLGEVSVALQASVGMRQQTFVASRSVRRLTPVETERLQGFPDGWTASQSDTQRYRQMGNAVAVPVAEWLMRRIVEQI